MAKPTRDDIRMARAHRRAKGRGLGGALFSTLRLANLYALLRDRHGDGGLPDDDDGRDSLRRLFDHLANASEPALRMANVARTWAPWMPAAELDALIGEVIAKPRRYRADTLARLFNVDFATRQRLRLWTIGSVDMDAKQRRQRRAEQSRIRSKRHRDERRTRSISQI